MKVLVCGGRNFRDKALLYGTMDALDRKHGIVTVIHGGASGADTLAGTWAMEWGCSVWVFSANWKKYGDAAGPIRNALMLEDGEPDLVVAFKGGKGTASMVKLARYAGVKVLEISENSLKE